MPSDGKPPLTKTEVAIIRWWIEKAMAAEGKKMSELADKATISPQVAFFLGLGGRAASGDLAGGLSDAPGSSKGLGTTDSYGCVAVSTIFHHINPDIPQ